MPSCLLPWYFNTEPYYHLTSTRNLLNSPYHVKNILNLLETWTILRRNIWCKSRTPLSTFTGLDRSFGLVPPDRKQSRPRRGLTGQGLELHQPLPQRVYEIRSWWVEVFFEASSRPLWHVTDFLMQTQHYACWRSKTDEMANKTKEMLPTLTFAPHQDPQYRRSSLIKEKLQKTADPPL